jgi:hypothetical protein
LKPASSDIFSIHSASRFRELALAVFHWQAAANPVYRRYIDTLGIAPSAVDSLEKIPFLPVELFKNFEIISGEKNPEATVFTSSGTTGMVTSRHVVTDISLYETSFRKGFELFYGDIRDYAVLALLPSYLEREGSSLVYMVNDLIRQSQNEASKFYLHDHEELLKALRLREDLPEHPGNARKKNLLLGVTYALLDLTENNPLQLKHTIIMETGGMKGRRREMVREELHEVLCKGFGVDAIHSEYGMTELLSQGYSKGNGIFYCPPWMQVMIRDTNDPFAYLPAGRTGGINVIDLANLNSCSFIATQDLGKKHPGDSFEVLGRFDNSDIRGCNLLVQ